MPKKILTKLEEDTIEYIRKLIKNAPVMGLFFSLPSSDTTPLPNANNNNNLQIENNHQQDQHVQNDNQLELEPQQVQNDNQPKPEPQQKQNDNKLKLQKIQNHNHSNPQLRFSDNRYYTFKNQQPLPPSNDLFPLEKLSSFTLDGHCSIL